MELEKQIKMPTNVGQDINYDNPSFQIPYQEGRDRPKISYGTGLIGKPKFVSITIGATTFYAPTEKPE